jgi:signal transduction histidine kinase
MAKEARELQALRERVAELERELEELRARVRSGERFEVLEQFAGAVAHELNNPLTGVIESMKILERHPADPERQRRFFPLILQGLGSISESVERLRSLSRLRVAAKEPASIGDVVARTVEFLAPRCESLGATLRLERPDEKVMVLCDPHAISQVVINLVNNALDAMASNPPARPREVTVAVSQADAQRAEVSVTDTGGGISPKARERLFDPFFTTKPTGKGTGLGLSISLRIAEQHGGSLRLSDGPGGVGTVATLSLPAWEGTGAGAGAAGGDAR